MNAIRLLILLAVLLPGSIRPATAQDDTLRDLTGIPLSPIELAEDGYLLEGGGYLTDMTTTNTTIATFDGGNLDALDAAAWQRTYMHRMILPFDTLDPGSDLLADVVTLVHAFDSDTAAAEAAATLSARLTDRGDAVDGDEPTWNVIVESANSLITVIHADDLVVQLISTDLTGRPDAAGHAAAVDAQIARLGGDTGTIASLVIALDDMKQTTFADEPEARLLQTMRDGEWLPVVGAQPGFDHEIVDAAESQSIVTLNTGDTVIVQSWIGRFTSDAAAETFAETLPLEDIPSVMLSDGAGPRLSGTLRSGERYSGFRAPVAVGDIVGVVGILAAGRITVSETDIARLADIQTACLQHGTCPPISIADLPFAAPATPAAGGTMDGVFTSAAFGWSVEYGALGWALVSEEPGDLIELRSGDSLATIETVVDRHGDPQTCILENTRLLEEFEEHAEITLGSDVERERAAGSGSGHAWAIYTVEPLADERADQEYTIRYDCYALIDGDASLVVSHTAPRDAWADESSKGDGLRDAIDLPAAA